MRHALVVSLLCSAIASAGETRPSFKADVLIWSVDGQQKREHRGVLYSAENNLRMERQLGGQQMVMILRFGDGKSVKSFMLMPAQKMAMDLSSSVSQAGGGVDPLKLRGVPNGNPCAAESDKTRTCKRVGRETVEGRKTTRWEISKDGKKETDVWIDDEILMMVKATSPEGGMRLTHIELGEQPPSLFEVPKDYQRRSVPTGMAPEEP